MINRIIFLPQNKLSERDFFRFGIDILLSKGYKVEVWDLTPVLRPYYFKNYNLPNPSTYENIKIFNNKKEIEEGISELTSKDIIVCMLHNNESTSFIFKELDKTKIKYGFISLTSNPENYSRKLRYFLFLDNVKQNPFLLFKKIFFIIKNIFLKGENYKASPSFILSGGKKGVEKFPQYLRNNKLEIINTHHLDYDEYLNNLSNEKPTIVDKKSYAVYIDMYLPFSMDTSHGNKKNQPSANADEFYPLINKFFEKFENRFGYEVVVAASPRSDYSGERKNLYGDRLVIRNKTHNLIKNSKCVLIHHSTAAGIAVLYNKPMVFLTPNIVDKKLKRRIEFMANNFMQKPLKISFDYIPSININPINEYAYETYKNNYIKMEHTAEKPIWEIFSKYLNSTNWNY
tara:strand:- start:37442 stop:38644 length:1203 start_codon:yes stop_codon:yes gene_type:complete